MTEEFNPNTPDRKGVVYFSYGATVSPALWSAFRGSHRIVQAEEGPNDGLVSVASSRWGIYKGTLVDVSHLDLINCMYISKSFLSFLYEPLSYGACF